MFRSNLNAGFKVNFTCRLFTIKYFSLNPNARSKVNYLSFFSINLPPRPRLTPNVCHLLYRASLCLPTNDRYTLDLAPKRTTFFNRFTILLCVNVPHRTKQLALCRATQSDNSNSGQTLIDHTEICVECRSFFLSRKYHCVIRVFMYTENVYEIWTRFKLRTWTSNKNSCVARTLRLFVCLGRQHKSAENRKSLLIYINRFVLYIQVIIYTWI